ncbi:hypothetical protein JXA02_11760 [candidate division KSB1 bacterium]|nr:hypothetical protein [candidate division KSB1 bacterium]RQW02129.1 MAG: hypothetical protein EH222_14070 [candidate division KSB1 bacterium]
MSDLTARDVKKRYTTRIMKIDGVVGIGIGKEEDDDAIMVFVKERTAIIDQKVPKQLKGYPVIIQETGQIEAFNDPSALLPPYSPQLD